MDDRHRASPSNMVSQSKLPRRLSMSSKLFTSAPLSGRPILQHLHYDGDGLRTHSVVNVSFRKVTMQTKSVKLMLLFPNPPYTTSHSEHTFWWRKIFPRKRARWLLTIMTLSSWL